ncbi:7-carboxy-7-deazaguanine synthase QueE [bacterium]|jgi:7-carboxy-7-deazaguanine synthase|nr:7-carboxy-7-deazaguanine synthase QueE [bacterium]
MRISESFYSIQGEGKSVGVPAVFLRLTGCNLTCSGFSYVLDGKALGCDTKAVWTKGEKVSCKDILDDWNKKGWIDALNRSAHLVITGGEPLIQQESIVEFLDELRKQCPDIFVEIETNGTITPNSRLILHVQQFNVSPKLANNGDSLEKRWKPDVLNAFVELPASVFKFVVQSREDVLEIGSQFLKVFDVVRHRIWLMPEGGTNKDMMNKSDSVVELCKEFGFNFSPRLQLTIWDQATGV